MRNERRGPHPAWRTVIMMMAGCVVAGCAVARPGTEPDAGIVVACIGDSITAGARSSDRAKNSYPAQLQRLRGDRYQVVNLGVGSCTLIRKGRPNVWTTLQRLKKGDVNPDYVVVSLGTNDTCGGERKCWDHKDDFPGDCRDLIHELRALPSRPRIWICAPTPMVLETPGLNAARRQNLEERKPRLQELVGHVKAIAAEKNVGFIDLNTPLADKPELFHRGDGVHMNDAGYRALAKLVHEGLHLTPSADVFPITFWAIHYWKERPEYERVISDAQYELIRHCNFNLVMGGPLEQAEKFGLRCASDAPHVKGMWWPPHEPVLPDRKRQLVVDAVSAVDRTSPALWGYHLCDEPPPVIWPRVKAVRQVIKSIDPDRPAFVNLHPGSDAAKYIAEVGAEVAAYDHYPIFDDGTPRDGKIPPGFENSSFLCDLARFRRDTLAAGLTFIPTMLSCGHSLDYEVKGVKYHRDYGRVTEARLRWQAYSALAYNAGGIAWFTYFTSGNPKYEEAAIGSDWRPTKIYGWLKQVNREAGAIGVILRGLRSVGAYESEPVHCWRGKRQQDLDRFPENGFITGVDGGLVSCGEFADDDGNTYLIIVNRNVNDAFEITPRLRWDQIAGIAVFDRQRCAWSDAPTWRTGDEALRLRLAPGDGVFVRATPARR